MKQKNVTGLMVRAEAQAITGGMRAPRKRTIEWAYVDNVEVFSRARPVSEEAVTLLMASMSSIGLQTPISVRYYHERPAHFPPFENMVDASVLMTGAHRLEAAKRLGWEKIECFLYEDGDEVDAQLWEIAENLHRSVLTKDQRDEHIRRYAELLKLREGVSPQIDAKPQGGRPEGVASKVAKETGLSKSTVERALNPERVAKEKAKAEREAKQAENDALRDQTRAALPQHVKAQQEARQAAIDARHGGARPETAVDTGLSLQDRIDELEEAVRVLEAENADLKAENKLYGEMKVQYTQGGFDKVVTGKDEEIRVLQSRLYQESSDKASWMKSAKYWQGEAKRLGWSNGDFTVDLETGEIADA